MSTPEISRKQAWMKLAVLIADGLPDPKEIDFNTCGDLITVQLDTVSAIAQWAEAFSARLSTPHQTDDGTWIHSGHGVWLGYSLQLNAYVKGDPESEDITEDLTEVRRLADG